MATRRMFSKEITRSDEFLDLPISSQALYFHLGMEADDRGYVNNPRSVIRSIGASVGDLEQLANKKFILIRDNSLILIKHWKINNFVRNDRFHETKYIDDLKKLFFDENNAYTENITKTPCFNIGIPHDNQMDTEVRLGKVSIGKDSIELDKNNKINSEINREEENIYDNNNTIDSNNIMQFVDEWLFQLEVSKYLEFNSSEKIYYKTTLEDMLKKYEPNNIKKSLEYFIGNTCAMKIVNGCNEFLGVRNDLDIKNKLSYFKTCMYVSCERFKNNG